MKLINFSKISTPVFFNRLATSLISKNLVLSEQESLVVKKWS